MSKQTVGIEKDCGSAINSGREAVRRLGEIRDHLLTALLHLERQERQIIKRGRLSARMIIAAHKEIDAAEATIEEFGEDLLRAHQGKE